MERFVAPRPDHSPPESLSAAELEQAIDSLRRKLRSVRASLRSARTAGGVVLAALIAVVAALLWAGPARFLPRIFERGRLVTVPELLAWWAAVIGAALVAGIVSYRVFAVRLHTVRGWQHRAHELEKRLEHAETESRRRGATLK